MAVVASGSVGSVVCAARQPADAAGVRQPTELKGRSCRCREPCKHASGSRAFLADGATMRRVAGDGAGYGCDRQGRISRPRRRLHRLPYRARRKGLRRRPADADAVRHALYVEHHARSANRHRHVDLRSILPDDAQGTFSRRRAGLSGDAVCLLYQGDARRQRRDLRLSALDRAGEADQQAARSEVSVQQPLADHRMADAVLQGGRLQARSDQIGGMESRRLSGGRVSVIAGCAIPPSTRWAAVRNCRPSRAG